MTQNNEKLYWSLLKKEFIFFLRHAFEQSVYPQEKFVDTWHVRAIAHSLMLGLNGERPRQILNLPPRSLKSFIASVAFTAFAIGHDPSCKIMCISYSEDLAKTFALQFRRIVTSAWYRGLFPELRWNKLTETEAVTDQGGGRYAIAVGGSVTGRGADIIVIDDPIKAADAQSENSRRSISEWFKNTLSSRLNDQKHGLIFLVMQRVHVGDLTGELDGTDFFKLLIPAIADKDEEIPVGNGKTYLRKAGEALQPARMDLATLHKLRRQMGVESFDAQYQQRPEMPSGNLFKRSYLQFQDTPVYDLNGQWWISVDAALSTSPWANFSAITLGYSVPGAQGPRTYIYGAKRGHWDLEELIVEVLKFHKRVSNSIPDAKIHFVVEKAAAGISLISYLKKRDYSVVAQLSQEDKESRAYRVLHAFREGRVWLVRKGTPADAWIEPFMAEVLTFPHCRFDDQVDSLVWGVTYAEMRVLNGYYA